MTDDDMIAGAKLNWLDAVARQAGVAVPEGSQWSVAIANVRANRDARVRREVFAGAVNAIVHGSDEAIALQAARRVDAAALGVLELGMSSGPTVEAGLRNVARYVSLLTRSVEVRVRTEGRERFEVLRVRPVDDLTARCLVEFLFGLLVVRIRAAHGGEWHVGRVSFRHAEPSYRGAYEELFHGPVEFGAELDAMEVPDGTFGLRYGPMDLPVGVVLRQGAAAAMSALPEVGSVSAQVRRTILEEVSRSIPHMTRVASRLGMSVSALHAVLRAESTTFAGIREELLHQLARTHLREPAFSVVDVAFVLGFADIDVFEASFERWSGQTPSAYRAQQG